MALVDVYDAVHTRRLYGAPLSHSDTIALIQKGSGTHFDPAVVEAFLAVADTLRALADDEDPSSDDKQGECAGQRGRSLIRTHAGLDKSPALS